MQALNPASARTERRNIAIQQLRGIAILLVFWYHIALSAMVRTALGTDLTNSAYAGVELFFVISGFVVASTMQRHGWSLRYFVARRLFRLYPPLLLFFAISLLVVLLGNAYPEGTFARDFFGSSLGNFAVQALTVLTGTFQVIPVPLYVNGVVWSLAVEFQFYFAFAVMLGICRALRLDATRTGQVLAAISTLLLALAFVARVNSLFGFPPPRYIVFMLRWKFDFLPAGVILALSMPWLSARLGTLPLSWPRRIAGGCILVALALLAFNRSPLDGASRFNVLEGLAMPLVLLLFLATMAAAALAPAGFMPRDPRLQAALVWFGDRSYGIYLMHFPCFALTWFAFYAFAGAWIFDPWIYSVAQLVCGGAMTLVAAELAFRFVERPAIALGAHLLRRQLKSPDQVRMLKLRENRSGFGP